ncbi:MetQ/NlpA family ABC transporter substrate-binding protein [Caldinitratiruptor microaerophilus]|uniref:Lipoprotein n=1 Tax=Caldinitratiruptor microaerophilus TaxID=671077 RepID=A0AA35CHE1_9FIRM|nr:MetQ/NlpA family ABC transporter substrate-binding protein [Caldinitratiruptor microaerophilus]BDG58994.1 metal ABC transporter substrate-binding protein [Caldinitratiruptor microaerophilus]
MRRVWLSFAVALTTLALLTGCGSKPAGGAAGAANAGAPVAGASDAGGATSPVVLRVGVTAGPHEQIMKEVAKLLEPQGIRLDIKVFTDYKIPNQALEAGDLDLNSFQHQPYLDTENKERGFHLVSIARTVTFPMGVYSRKIQKLDEIRQGGTVAIPNDPTNGGRALLVLQQAGLIKLKPEAGILASPRDVVENPKGLRFQELDAAQLPRVLPDVDAAVINTNYAMEAGLNPRKDAIFVEQNSPYVNVIAVREKEKDRPEFRKVVEAYHSPQIRKFIEETFQGAVVPGF